MEVLMGKMYKLSIEIISRHDVHSRKGNEVKRSTKWVFCSPNESVTETFNDDNIVNYGRKLYKIKHYLKKKRVLNKNRFLLFTQG